MEDYRFLYKQCKLMLEKYQDELIPQFRAELAKTKEELAEVKAERDEALRCLNKVKETTTDRHSYNMVTLFFGLERGSRDG